MLLFNNFTFTSFHKFSKRCKPCNFIPPPLLGTPKQDPDQRSRVENASRAIQRNTLWTTLPSNIIIAACPRVLAAQRPTPSFPSNARLGRAAAARRPLTGKPSPAFNKLSRVTIDRQDCIGESGAGADDTVEAWSIVCWSAAGLESDLSSAAAASRLLSM